MATSLKTLSLGKTISVLCWFVGTLGIHRYMMGYDNWWKQLITLGGCGIWTIIDLIKLFTDQLPMADGTPLKKD